LKKQEELYYNDCLMKKALVEKIKQIPQKPGVYLFKNKGGRIIYIGKTIKLKNRVLSHFAKNGSNIFKGDFELRAPTSGNSQSKQYLPAGARRETPHQKLQRSRVKLELSGAGWKKSIADL